MKPDWSTAPEWAKFLAQDPNGDWYWHEREPEWVDGEWWSLGQWTKAGHSYPATLEARP